MNDEQIVELHDTLESKVAEGLEALKKLSITSEEYGRTLKNILTSANLKSKMEYVPDQDSTETNS